MAPMLEYQTLVYGCQMNARCECFLVRAWYNYDLAKLMFQHISFETASTTDRLINGGDSVWIYARAYAPHGTVCSQSLLPISNVLAIWESPRLRVIVKERP
jgi:hypothetical protein